VTDSATLARSWRRTVGGYIALTKPSIIELLLVTTIPTMIVANSELPDHQVFPRLGLIIATFVGGALAAGGANAFNMVIDRDIDAIMERTKRRPLVTGVMTPRAATVFAVALQCSSLAILGFLVNWLSALLALGATLFYVFVYTLWLKRRSKQNVLIGGVAGAMPVLIGWTAVTNGLGWPPVLLFIIMIIWQPPHTYVLAIRYRDDYMAVNVPMLPVVASLRRTTLEILIYSVILWATSVLIGPTAGLGWIYAISATVLGGAFTFYAWRLDALARKDQADVAQAMRLFHFSITYLTGLFVMMALDVLVQHA
jgi:protoheme IX farnesyltransferase